MQSESKQVPPCDPGTEYLVLLQLLRADHPERWLRSELERELYDVDPDAIGDSLAALAAVGVVMLDGKTIQASPCAWRIDGLDMIGL